MDKNQVITISDWIMICAVLLAPVIAVQVQKWMENFREDKSRKLLIFKSLMSTRATSLSNEHVQSLNMIDLEFNNKKYSNVTSAWKTYLDHLNSYPRDNESLQPVWADKRIDFLAKLLQEMGHSLGYDFDEVHIKKGIYIPEAHTKLEDDNIKIRQGLINIIEGEKSLNINVKDSISI